MADKLHNSLMEMLVVIGLNDPVSMYCNGSKDSGDIETDESYPMTFVPQIIAAISPNAAVFPTSASPYPKPDVDYPPRARRASSQQPECVEKALPGPPLTRGDKGIMRQKNGRAALIKKNEEVRQSQVAGLKRSLTMKVKNENVAQRARGIPAAVKTPATELPISTDELSSLIAFCFPDDCVITEDVRSNHVHYLVLTDIVGSRTYAVCLTYYIKHQLPQRAAVGWRVATLDRPCNDPVLRQHRFIYIPQCYVFISKLPYFTVMKDCLSRLIYRLEKSPDEWHRVVKEFTLQLSLTLVPPAGVVNIFTLYDVLITVPCADSADRRPVDFKLDIVLRYLDSQTILLIMTALMTQQRLLFVSSSYATLTLISEAFFHFLSPFTWKFVYVPLLPFCLLELLEAPGTFIMGCHAKHWRIASEIEGLVSVNLDEGSVHVCQTVELPCLPKGQVVALKDSLRNFRMNLDHWKLDSVTTFSYEESRAAELEHQMKSNRKLSLLFLEFMANLFRGILRHVTVKSETRFFHMEQFLEDVSDTDRPFYERVMQTEMFGTFLKDRLDRKQDVWTDFVERRKLSQRSSQFELPLLKKDRPPTRLLRNAASMSNITSSLCNGGSQTNLNQDCTQYMDHVNLHLPSFHYALSHMYLDNCFQDISATLQKALASPEEHNAYIYMRAVLSAARGNKMTAIEDFCRLEKNGSRLFPSDYVYEMMSLMSSSEKEALLSSDVYRLSPVLEKLQSQHEDTVDHAHSKQVVTTLKEIAKQHIDLEVFTQLVGMLHITNHTALAERLFTALTLNQSSVVDPVTFELFYQSWKENEADICRGAISSLGLATNEDVLKISDLIKCTIGTGQMVLTQNRILYQQEGVKKLQEIIRLCDIRAIEKVQTKGFFKQISGLRIFHKYEGVRHFTMYFQEEDLMSWYLFLHEMRAGKMLSEELNDPSIVQIAAQNVMLLNAFIRSGDMKACLHHNSVQELSPSLCYFMSVWSESPPSPLTADTLTVLLRRLDPNAGCEREKRMAIEAILYTPSVCSADCKDDVPQRLWCGLESGKILVYNTSTWLLEHQLTQTNRRVSCLLLATDGYVWAGSFDKNIYIIDNELEVTIDRVLDGHVDLVVDLKMSLCANEVYSADLDGHIIVWSVINKTIQRQLTCEADTGLRRIILYNDKLWCCCRDVLRVLSLDGSILHRLTFMDNFSKIADVDCCIITPWNEVWVGLRKVGQIRVFHADSFQEVQTLAVPCKGVSAMLVVNSKVWVGSKERIIHVFDGATYHREKQLEAHTDRILVMHAVPGFFIVTASGSRDGRLAVWTWPLQ